MATNTTHDLRALYDQASTWAASKVDGAAAQLDAPTPCDDWDVRALLNHMIDTQEFFTGSAKGEDVSMSMPTPPERVGDDPSGAFRAACAETARTFAEPGVVERTGPSLGIAFSDMLLHGWDVAKATGQDTAMPEGLPDAAYELVHGKFTDEQRKGVFKPEVKVPDSASPQDRLLAYTGRDPG
jgi:uncharacterized protein (TIGR03086 family)